MFTAVNVRPFLLALFSLFYAARELSESKRCTAVKPELTFALGGADCAVFLQQLLWWSDKKKSQDNDGWFYVTRERLLSETGLTFWQQQRVRKQLLELNLIDAKRAGSNGRMNYRVNREEVIGLVAAKKLKPLKNRDSRTSVELFDGISDNVEFTGLSVVGHGQQRDVGLSQQQVVAHGQQQTVGLSQQRAVGQGQQPVVAHGQQPYLTLNKINKKSEKKNTHTQNFGSSQKRGVSVGTTNRAGLTIQDYEDFCFDQQAKQGRKLNGEFYIDRPKGLATSLFKKGYRDSEVLAFLEQRASARDRQRQQELEWLPTWTGKVVTEFLLPGRMASWTDVQTWFSDITTFTELWPAFETQLREFLVNYPDLLNRLDGVELVSAHVATA